MSVLDGFSVLAVPRTYSMAEVRIRKNKLSFNLAVAQELGYPAFVRLYISDDRTQIAIQTCSMDTPNANVFFTQDTSSKNKKAISIGTRAIIQLIRKGMDWETDETIFVPGVRFAEEEVIIFDLKQATVKERRANGVCKVPVPCSRFYEIPRDFNGRQLLLLGDGSQRAADFSGAVYDGQIVEEQVAEC